MRRILVRALQGLGVLLVLAVFVAFGGGYWFISKSFPQTSGSLQVPGISSRVEIARDVQGVPHIYAASTDDLFFAQGYVHAQDRLWQMEFNRHIGHGELAELFGADQVENDKFLRTIGLERAAQADLRAMDPDTLRVLQRYADGVNAFIHTHQDNLPLEFTLLGVKPSDWQPIDSLVWGKVMAYNLGGNYDMELLRSRLAAQLGNERAAQLTPPYPATGPFIIPADVKSYASAHPAPAVESNAEPSLAIGKPDLEALSALNRSLDLMGKGVGSNNWVVDGTRTTTGKPLLANDPHLGIQMPSIWYTDALHCQPISTACPFDVAGYSFPGAPGIIIGHNRRVAWGVTNTGPDVEDLYVEKLNPSNPNQYWYQGQWQNMQLVTEVIHVKGQADVPLTVQLTRHGPVMTPVLKGVTATLALQWTATNAPSTLFQSVLDLNRAGSWDEFRKALRLWDVPAENFVYADVDGNIGYQLPGRIPIRAQGDGRLPVDGSTGAYEWTGYIPFDELPFTYNPPSHYIVTANNQVVPNGYKYWITADFDPPFRSQRINDLLHSESKLSPADFARIQADLSSLPMLKLQKYVSGVKPTGFLGERALKYVQGWDGRMTTDTIGGTILEVTYLKLVQDLFQPALGADLFASYLRNGDVHHLLIDQLLDDPNNSWWDDPATPQRETREDRLTKAYQEGVDWLGSQFGDWPPDWHWSRVHTATFVHPFGSIKPLNLLFNFGPMPVPGDNYTVFRIGFDNTKPYEADWISSMREILDLSDLDNSQWIHTTGESGQPLNSHYTDLTAMWRDGKYAPLYFTRDAVDKVKSGDLYLTP